MDMQPTPPPRSRKNGTLIEPTDAEQRQALDQWQRIASGMDGERITHLEKPDDPVAYKLLEAADQAIERGRIQEGLNILRLVVRDYRQSQEAALARQAIDQIRKQADHGR